MEHRRDGGQELLHLEVGIVFRIIKIGRISAQKMQQYQASKMHGELAQVNTLGVFRSQKPTPLVH